MFYFDTALYYFDLDDEISLKILVCALLSLMFCVFLDLVLIEDKAVDSFF